MLALCKNINPLIFQLRLRFQRRWTVVKLGHYLSSRLLLLRSFQKSEVTLNGEEGSSKPPEGCNEAEMSDFGRAAFKQCTFIISKHFNL